jgi:hypothetical protein
MKHAEVEIPGCMRDLPMTSKGYLKPWFVKADDFRVVDNNKAKLAIEKKNCWICGKPFTDNRYALVGSPLSAVTRIFREPPCHQSCAEYAMQVCPFILYADAKRRDAGLPEELSDQRLNEGLKVKHDPTNPGEYYLITVDDFQFNRVDMTLHYLDNNILDIQYWIQGHRQKAIPNPILDYDDLPEEVRIQISRPEFYRKYRTRKFRNNQHNWTVLSYAAVGDYAWSGKVDQDYINEQSFVPLNAYELIHAVHHLPTGFLKQESSYQLVGIVGFGSLNDAFKNSNGEWSLPFLPNAFSTFPFRIGIEGDSVIIQVDTNSNQILEFSNTKPESIFSKCYPLFQNEQKLANELLPVLETLKKHLRDTRTTDAIVELLTELHLIRSWKIKLSSSHEQKAESINALYCIDETRLENLSAKELLQLRDTGALTLIYCQLLSMSHIKKLLNL